MLESFQVEALGLFDRSIDRIAQDFAFVAVQHIAGCREVDAFVHCESDSFLFIAAQSGREPFSTAHCVSLFLTRQ